MRYFQDIEYLIAENNLAATGCSEAGIALLQSTLAYKIPVAYQEFLLLFGGDKAGFFAWDETELEYLQSMREEADEILLRNNVAALTAEDFVFQVHQNYSFFTFKLDAGDDPDILLCIEGDAPFEQWTNHGSFSAYIKKEFWRYLQGGYLRQRH